MVGTLVAIDGQVAEGVVELLVIYPQQTTHQREAVGHPVEESHSLLALCVVEDAELDEQHQFARIAQAYHHSAQESAVLTLVVEGKSVLVGIVTYAIAQFVVHVIHQMTGFDGKYLVERTAGVEPHSARHIEGFARRYLLSSQPSLVGEAELQFVAVSTCLLGTQNGTAGWQFHSAYPLEGVHHLLLLGCKLCLIRQALPLAAATNAEVGTEGLRAGFTILVKTDSHSLGVMMFLARHLQVNYVTWNHIRHKDYHIIHPGKSFSLGRNCRYFHVLQQG